MKSRKPARRRRTKTLRGSDVDHRELAKLHFAEAAHKLVEVEQAARNGDCHKALQFLVGAGAEHGIALAHARETRDPAFERRAQGIGARLNLLTDTIGFQCTRPRRG